MTFPDDIQTVTEAGLSGLKNSQLLRAAVKLGFDYVRSRGLMRQVSLARLSAALAHFELFSSSFSKVPVGIFFDSSANNINNSLIPGLLPTSSAAFRSFSICAPTSSRRRPPAS